MREREPSESWDQEYKKQGVPSSFKDQPSGVLLWTLDAWSGMTGAARPARAIDVGCGTGRNSIYMAEQGIKVLGFDSSSTAIELANQRLGHSSVDNVEFVRHDLTDGLPGGSGEYDFIADIFVYKHQLHPDARAAYRAQMRRVLSDNGRILISLAEPSDGYYSTCPQLDDPALGPHAIEDPHTGVGSVLFTRHELENEMADNFRLTMFWHKVKLGRMHGDDYTRHTLATIWEPAV